MKIKSGRPYKQEIRHRIHENLISVNNVLNIQFIASSLGVYHLSVEHPGFCFYTALFVPSTARGPDCTHSRPSFISGSCKSIHFVLPRGSTPGASSWELPAISAVNTPAGSLCFVSGNGPPSNFIVLSFLPYIFYVCIFNLKVVNASQSVVSS